MKVPHELIWPVPEFADSFASMADAGRKRLPHASIAFVGLARSCAGHLRRNLVRASIIGAGCKQWWLHVEENDSTDDTVHVLAEFCTKHRQATFTSQKLDREHYGAEFAGRRTIALAEYRDACQRWVRDCAADADYVVIVDFDAWGGWSFEGFLNGLGWLVELQGAYGMASVSLFEHTSVSLADDHAIVRPAWLHYDCWSLRGIGQPDNYWDDYTKGQGGWKYQWLPPVGSEPVPVASAFGGMCIYRTEPYLAGTYDGTEDCEHVPYHASVRRSTGQRLYVCPSMRTVMRWLEREDGGQHSND